MKQEMLVPVAQLHGGPGKEDFLIVDCRFALDKPDAGFNAYCQSHIPGAVYANLDRELSSPVTETSGRHPLPDGEKFSKFLARLGWQPGRTLLVYDDLGGAIAARLWWLMKYFGHESAAMLDGGINAWIKAGYPLEGGPVEVKSVPVAGYKENKQLVLSSDEVAQCLDSDSIVLIDARAPERFTGKVEPIDRVAGHIPGAVNYPFNLNLDADGLFKSVSDIRESFSVLTKEPDSKNFVHMCGSGVTACHNIFAAELAGIEVGKLYVGSWSEWIQNPSRPVEP